MLGEIMGSNPAPRRMPGLLCVLLHR